MVLVSERLAAAVVGAAPGFMPERASSVAAGVDRVFAFIFWLSAFFLALIVVLTVVFVVRYRKRASRLEPEPSPSHDMRLELLWSGIPLALVFVIFGVSTKTYSRMTKLDPAAAPLRIQVTARKWSWWFDHPGGKGAGARHLPHRLRRVLRDRPLAHERDGDGPPRSGVLRCLGARGRRSGGLARRARQAGLPREGVRRLPQPGRIPTRRADLQEPLG